MNGEEGHLEIENGPDLSLASAGRPPQHKQQQSTANNKRSRGTSTATNTAPVEPETGDIMD